MIPLLSLLCLVAVVRATYEGPFPRALTFGPSRISISQWKPAGNVEIINIPTNNDFLTYFKDAIAYHTLKYKRNGKWYITEGDTEVPAPPEIHDNEAITAMFREVVHDASWDVADCSAAFLPTFLNDTSSATISRAVFPNGQTPQDGPKKLGFFPSAASFAYGLDRCENFGQTPAECATEDVENHILVIEYEQEYMNLSLLDVYPEFFAFPSMANKMSRKFGELSRGDIQENLGAEVFTQELKDFLENFMEEAIKNQHTPLNREDVRAIIVAGDVSAEASKEVQELAREAVGNKMVRVFDSIDSKEVLAHGAALYARETVLRRDLWGYPPIHQYPHDEL